MTRASIRVQIQQPCAESWEAMTPTAQGRYCAACQHTVTDFTHRTDAEILALLRQAAGARVCGRFRAEQLNREMVQAPVAAPRWRAWLVAAAALWGVPAAAQSLRPTHSGGPTPTTTQLPGQGPNSGPAAPIPPTHLTGDTTLLADPLMGKATPVPATPSVIRGRVLEENSGLGLPGATVLLKGTNLGTSTDAEGRFMLVTTQPQPALLISSIGYVNQELAVVPGSDSVRVTLTADTRMLGEMVVVGGVTYAPWYTPRGLWHRLRALPRRLFGQ